MARGETMLLVDSNTSHYRARTYKGANDGETRYLANYGDLNELDAWLETEVHAGRATGGDIEMWVIGIGWCVYND